MKQKSIARLMNYLIGIPTQERIDRVHSKLSKLEADQFEDVTETIQDSWNRILMRDDKILIYDPRVDEVVATYERRVYNPEAPVTRVAEVMAYDITL